MSSDKADGGDDKKANAKEETLASSSSPPNANTLASSPPNANTPSALAVQSTAAVAAKETAVQGAATGAAKETAAKGANEPVRPVINDGIFEGERIPRLAGTVCNMPTCPPHFKYISASRLDDRSAA